MKTSLRFALALLAAALFVTAVSAQVPQMMSYQGRVQSGGVNFNGTGKFKFVLISPAGTFWSNDGTSSSGSEPTNAVSLTVTNGVYSVLLGDTSIANMTQAISNSVFNISSSVSLRVWFDDGVHGSQLLTPDQRIAATGWSMVSSTVGISGVTTNSIANGAVTAAKIAPVGITNPGITASQIANNTITGTQLATAAVGSGQIANGAVGLSQISIAATTKVANLNADLLDGFDSTAFVKKSGDTMTGAFTASSSAFSAITGVTSANNGNGIVGEADTGADAYGVYGKSSSGFAGFFDGKVQINGVATVQVLTITGGSDLAEPFNLSKRNIPKGSVVVIDESAPGNLTLSNRPYDQRVAGIVSGANGVKPGIQLHQEGVMDGDENVALSGRVYVRADASNGAIKPGDLLTTSRVPGHAMRVTSHAKAQGAIIGKAMSSLDDGDGMVLVLVTLQ